MRVESGRLAFGVRRDAKYLSVVDAGPPVVVSPFISHSRRRAVEMRFTFEPHTRCTIEWVSVRRALTLAEIVR